MIRKTDLLTAALLGAVSADPATPPKYNGQLKLFIADIGPMYPCHPMYDRSWTDANALDQGDDFGGIRAVLNGLADQGFNAVRLPLWPESDKIVGKNGETRNECDLISKYVNEAIHSTALDFNGNRINDKYHFFTLYYSPAFDAKRHQEELSS